MSLRQTLEKTIQNIMMDYTKVLANTYNLEQKDLLALWEGTSNTTAPDPKGAVGSELASEIQTTLDPVYLLKCLKPELKVLCKQRGLRCTGTKAQLLCYLQGNTTQVSKSKAKSKAKSKTKKKGKKKGSETQKVPSLLKNLSQKVPIIAIRKNQFGNHEHPESHLVFDKKLKKAIGIQSDDGTIKPLTKEDIDICNKFKFSYVLPENLDRNVGLEDEKVDELEDEELVEDEELEDEYEEVYE